MRLPVFTVCWQGRDISLSIFKEAMFLLPTLPLRSARFLAIEKSPPQIRGLPTEAECQSGAKAARRWIDGLRNLIRKWTFCLEDYYKA